MKIKNNFATLLTLALSLTTLLIGELDTDWLNITRKTTRHDWDGGFTQKDIAGLKEDDRVYLKTEITQVNKKTSKQETVPLYARGVITKKDTMKNSLEVVYKVAGFTPAQVAGFDKGKIVRLKQVSRPHFKKLIMLIDDGVEKSAGAVTGGLIYAVHQKAAPILVSGNLIRNYLDVAQDPSAYQKTLAPSLKHFNLSNWIIRQLGRFYLLIPKNIIPQVMQLAPNDTPEVIKNKTAAISQYFGLYLEPEIKTDGGKTVTRGEGIVSLSTAITARPTDEKQRQEWLSSLSTKIRNNIDFKKEIQPFFREKVFIEIEGEKIVEGGSWIIYLSGHGLPNEFIAGFSIDEFAKFLDFISSKLTMSLLYYSSCYAGGTNFSTIQENFAKDFDNFKSRNLSFIVATGSLTEELGSSAPPVLQSNGIPYVPKRTGEMLIPGTNFNIFFKNAIDYLTNKTKIPKEKDPLKTLYEFEITEKKSNIPNTYIPATGYQKTIQHELLIPITKTMIAAKKHPMETVIEKKATQLKSEGVELKITPTKAVGYETTIDVGSKHALLYANNISVPVKITTGVFIPKEREKIYSFIEIITNHSADLFLNTPYFYKIFMRSGHADTALKTLNQRSFVIECKKLSLGTSHVLTDVIWHTGKSLAFTYENKEFVFDLETPLRTWLKDPAWGPGNDAPVPSPFANATSFITKATQRENKIFLDTKKTRFNAELYKHILEAGKYLSQDIAKKYLAQEKSEYPGKLLFTKITEIYKLLPTKQKIMDASKNNNVVMIEQLAKEKTNFDFVDPDTKYTPLTAAIANHHPKITQILIESGCDVNLEDELHLSPLAHATDPEKIDIARVLIEKGATINNDVLDAAIYYNNAPLATIIIQKQHQLLNNKNPEGNTALHRAVLFKKPKIAKLLIDAGADFTIRNHKGYRALDLARNNNQTEIIQLIQEKMWQKK